MAARNLLLYHLFHLTLLLDPVLFHAFFAEMQNKKFINKGGRLFCRENCDAAAALGQKMATWPQGRKKIVSDFIPTERLLLTERPPKGLKIANKP